MKNRTGKRLLFGLSICVILGMICGCASVPASGEVSSSEKRNREVKNVLIINNRPVTDEEACIYIYLMQKPYETCYGSDIWEEQRENGIPWEDWLLEEVKRQIIELEILSSRAEKEGMILTDEEKASADAEADAAFEAMADTADRYNITCDTVRSIYEKSRLAGLYYQTVTDSYNLTLSEDELSQCRAMTVQQIFIAEGDTAHLEDGQTQEQLADQLQKRAVAGEDFETLAKAYSSGNAQWILSFDEDGYVFDTDAWLEEDFVKSAWTLEENEITPVIHSSYGYHVLKCTDVDSDELKQQAGERILNEKKQKTFAAEYEKWLQDVICTEEAAWQEIHVLEGI